MQNTNCLYLNRIKVLIIMRSIKLFRVDKRDFEVGDIIESAKEFLRKGPPGAIEIEKQFEKMRPDTFLPRTHCLFLFERINDAQKHWSKMSEGKLYEVTVDNISILHRADMNLVDLAYKNLKDEDKVKFYATQYWSGVLCSSSIVEVLVRSATVSSIISKCQKK